MDGPNRHQSKRCSGAAQTQPDVLLGSQVRVPRLHHQAVDLQPQRPLLHPRHPTGPAPERAQGRMSAAPRRDEEVLDPNSGINVIGVEELKQKIDRRDDFKLVNALGEWEFQAKHIPGSLHLHTVDDAVAALSPTDEIVVYCSNPLCRASSELYKGLHARGYRHIRRFAGGMAAWEEAGYPLEGEWVEIRE